MRFYAITNELGNQEILFTFFISCHQIQWSVLQPRITGSDVPASLSHLTSKKSEKPTGSKPLLPIIPSRLEGAERNGMLLDFSPAMVILLILRLAEGATNAEHPAYTVLWQDHQRNSSIAKSYFSWVFRNTKVTDKWGENDEGLEHCQAYKVISGV